MLRTHTLTHTHVPLHTSHHTGPNKHTLTQIKDAIHDGLRAVKNAIEDGSVVPGGGAFEVVANYELMSAEFLNSVQGRAKFGVKVGVCFIVLARVNLSSTGFRRGSYDYP